VTCSRWSRDRHASCGWPNGGSRGGQVKRWSDHTSRAPAGGAVGRGRGSCGRSSLACSEWRVRLEFRSSQMTIACSTWHRPSVITVRGNRSCSFSASVWPRVWMLSNAAAACSITPCLDSGLLDGKKKLKKETLLCRKLNFWPCHHHQQDNMRLETAHGEGSQVSLIVYY
jgi:hypothetical protein